MNILDQLAALNRDVNAPVSVSASFTLQANTQLPPRTVITEAEAGVRLREASLKLAAEIAMVAEKAK